MFGDFKYYDTPSGGFGCGSDYPAAPDILSSKLCLMLLMEGRDDILTVITPRTLATSGSSEVEQGAIDGRFGSADI